MCRTTTLARDRRIVTAWLDPELVEALDELAREADRSRSAELRLALKGHVERAAQLKENHEQ